MELERGSMPKDLISEPSPSLPKDFPSELIPKNICEVEFFDLIRCTYQDGAQMTCPKEYKKFLECKRDRDLKLFNALQKWEIQRVKDHNPAMQQLYKQGLQNKISRLTEAVSTMPTNFWYLHKRQRYQTDIEQLQWRLFNLNKYV
ncbi:unnamed protein product [Paramecium sonneborni]|uniref:CHCH domain-containing protein n=1 Tax=Paramecium sonneborni TaxID=65129 RepID=A0A8S1R5L1_9CILI|nr:unnamed protein product [Paramecium sonneborni]